MNDDEGKEAGGEDDGVRKMGRGVTEERDKTAQIDKGRKLNWRKDVVRVMVRVKGQLEMVNEDEGLRGAREWKKEANDAEGTDEEREKLMEGGKKYWKSKSEQWKTRMKE